MSSESVKRQFVFEAKEALGRKGSFGTLVFSPMINNAIPNLTVCVPFLPVETEIKRN